MAVAKLDQNSRPTLTAVSSSDGATVVPLYADPVTHRLLTDTAAGSGTVTSVSVVSANGFAGTVANATTTPAITLSTTITGVLKGNGTAISAASAGTDYVAPGAITTSGLTMSTAKILGRATAGTGAIEEIAETGTGSVVLDTNATLTNPTFSNANADTIQASTTSSGFIIENHSGVAVASFGVGSTSSTNISLSGNVALGVNNITMTGSIASTGSRVTKIWATDLDVTNTITGSISGNAATVTTNANLTGVITSIGNATSIASQTGTGTKFVVDTSPTLVTPTIGVATATSINKMAITAPATSSTLAVADGKTLTASNTLTLAGTDSTTMTFPTTSATIARTDAAQTFTGTQTFSQVVTTANAITASANAATIPVTSRHNIVTNNSAATLTITLTTTSAVNMQTVVVQILDFSAVAQTITWVNTEDSTVTAPTTSNGSTTLPLTVGFMYNSATSKWRTIAKC